MRTGWLRALALATVLASAACGALTVGKEFPSPKRDALRNGATTRAELERLFGPPTQVGVKDGDESWTWYYYKKGNPDLSKQLDVTFNPDGVMKSHSFSSNFPEDMKPR
jgi:outer membrane protein assembly factor BamE (lipoprotein component of BamABCDE complex)